MSLGVVLLAYAITVRVTRFVVDDALFGPVRAAAIRWRGPSSWLVVLIGCYWCVSVWVAAVVATLALFWGDSRWFLWAGLVAGLSYAASEVPMTLAALRERGGRDD